MIELRLLTKSDVDDLHPRLRIADQTEAIVLGSNPREALLMGFFDNLFQVSKGRAYGLWDEGDLLIGAIGFTSSGYLWALSAEFTPRQRKELFKRTREIIVRLLTEAKQRGALFADNCLVNVIHSRNNASIKWLQHSGLFEVDTREIELASNGEVFYPFRSKSYDELTGPCASHS